MSEEYKRSLAHIEKIVDIRPISGADQIEMCRVLGWECVIKKNEYKVGDLIVYVEVDSIVPEKPEFEFLRDRKFRVKTIKLRKQISQGLVLPLTVLPPITATNPHSWEHWKKSDCEGCDVTKILGITHHDPESSLNQKDETNSKIHNHPIVKFILKYSLGRKLLLPFLRKPKGAWPGYWLAKTDEPRLQNIPSLLERYKDEDFYITEKIDYQSVTFFTRKMKNGIFNKKIFGVCSRNFWLKSEDNSLYWDMARKYKIENILREYNEEITIQAEQGNLQVQGNKYGIKEPQMWIFNIINNRTNYHFSVDEMRTFCIRHELPMVPVLDEHFKLKSTVQEMVEYAKGYSVLNPKVLREGVVFRLVKNGEKLVSFKVISPDFLLKNNE